MNYLNLWNNRDVKIENKSVYWKAWRDKNVRFIQDLLNDQGNDPTPQEVGVKYNIKVNFLHYYLLISALPTHLKSEASAHTDLGNLNLVGVRLDFHLAKDLNLNWKKTSCKQFYKSFAEKIYTEPTTIKRGGTIALKLLTIGCTACKVTIKSLGIIS